MSLPIRCRCRGLCLTVLVLATCGSPSEERGRAVLSDSIKVDQVGYLPGRPKLAMVADQGATGTFSVRRTGGAEVLSGRLGPAAADPDSGDMVRMADFSGVREAGSFYLEVAGVGISHEFEIGPAVYRHAFELALRSFYGQRCGTAVDMAPRYQGYSHPACHVEGTRNPDAAFHSSAGLSGSVDGRRGWHDAGDYGKYVVNSGITTGQLLWTYEVYRERVRGVSLDIPESGNAVPDLLDEIRWNLDWMVKMQDGDGGVWHKLTSERFGGFVMPHLDDGGPRFVIGTGSSPFKSSCATADFAAVMAAAARVYEPFDGEFAALALTSAERAWRWLERYPDVTFRNCCGVQTGEYGDGNCADERLWAAAELFRTTGEERYDAYFRANHGAFSPAVSGAPPQSWQDVHNLAMFAYYFSGRAAADAAVRSRIAADTLAAADAVVSRTNASAYRVSLRPTDYVWGSNGVAANYGVLLALAHAIRPEGPYLDAAAENLHYLFGRNSFGLCWVTRLGERPFRSPHHRPSGADANAEPWPGLLSGGPNRYGGDPVIDAMPFTTPPARRYRDDQASYASNENAINWNAPLVFLLASLLPEPR